jgi:putative ABC transport system permease protein
MRPLARPPAAWVLLTGTGAAASIAFGLLVFAAVLASLAIPREGEALRTQALQRTLAASPPGDKTVIGTTGLTGLLAASQYSPAKEIGAVRAALASRLASGGVPLASGQPAWSGLTSGYTPVAGAPAAAGGGRAKLEVMYRSALAHYCRVVTGHLPVGTSIASGHQIVQVAVTQPTAARFGLHVGSRLAAGREMTIQVTGIIEPEHQDTSFWSQNPGTVRPLLMPGQSAGSSYYIGAVFAGSGAIARLATLLNPDYMQVTWVLPVRLNRLTADQAGSLRSGVEGITATGLVMPGAQGGAPVTVVSRLPGILGPFIAEDRAVAPVLGLMYVGLAVAGAVVVLLAAWLVAERRYAEFALIRARGAGLWDIAWRTLRASGTVAVVAAAAAATTAIRLTPADGDRLGWWLAGITVAITVAGPVLITVAQHRVPGPAKGGHAGRADRQTARFRRLVTETGLMLLAIGGLAVLRAQGLPAGGMNLYPSAAPVLIAVPVAVLVLRCYPPMARALARMAGRSRGVVGFVGLARATRTSAGATLPAFALVLVFGMVTFSAMIAAAVTRSQVAASWRQVGADAIIEAPANGVITPELQHQIAAVPGVSGAAAAVISAGSLEASGAELQAVFVDPATYAAVADQAPGVRFPLAALSRNQSAASAAIPAAATRAAAQLARRAAVRLDLNTRTITIRMAGRIGGIPGDVVQGPVVVLPLRALGQHPPEPDLMLVAGPHLNTQRLRSLVSRALPGGTLTLRAAALAALAGAPIPQAARTTLVQGAVTAAGFGILVLLLSLVLTARARDMTLARLATMGLRQRQAQLLIAIETLPQIVAVAVGGIACAAVLAPLAGPSMDLSALTGPGPSVVVVPDLATLAASAAGLVLAALLALAAQAAITYRQGSAGPLRIAE